jgi:hypothetical protein
MDIIWLVTILVFFGICLLYVGFLAKEGKTWKT